MKLLWEWWIQMWPNLASSGVTFGLGLLWARRRFLIEMEHRELAHLRRHEELRTLIENQGGQS